MNHRLLVFITTLASALISHNAYTADLKMLEIEHEAASLVLNKINFCNQTSIIELKKQVFEIIQKEKPKQIGQYAISYQRLTILNIGAWLQGEPMRLLELEDTRTCGDYRLQHGQKIQLHLNSDPQDPLLTMELETKPPATEGTDVEEEIKVKLEDLAIEKSKRRKSHSREVTKLAKLFKKGYTSSMTLLQTASELPVDIQQNLKSCCLIDYANPKIRLLSSRYAQSILEAYPALYVSKKNIPPLYFSNSLLSDILSRQNNARDPVRLSKEKTVENMITVLNTIDVKRTTKAVSFTRDAGKLHLRASGWGSGPANNWFLFLVIDENTGEIEACQQFFNCLNEPIHLE